MRVIHPKELTIQGVALKVIKDNRHVDLARIHGADEHRSVDQNADRKERVQNKCTEPCLEGGSRKVIFVIFEDSVQDRIQRYDQKCLQGFVDQIKPFHLSDDVKYTGLPTGGDQEGLDCLIDRRNQGKRAKRNP